MPRHTGPLPVDPSILAMGVGPRITQNITNSQLAIVEKNLVPTGIDDFLGGPEHAAANFRNIMNGIVSAEFSLDPMWKEPNPKRPLLMMDGVVRLEHPRIRDKFHAVLGLSLAGIRGLTAPTFHTDGRTGLFIRAAWPDHRTVGREGTVQLGRELRPSMGRNTQLMLHTLMGDIDPDSPYLSDEARAIYEQQCTALGDLAAGALPTSGRFHIVGEATRQAVEYVYGDNIDFAQFPSQRPWGNRPDLEAGAHFGSDHASGGRITTSRTGMGTVVGANLREDIGEIVKPFRERDAAGITGTVVNAVTGFGGEGIVPLVRGAVTTVRATGSALVGHYVDSRTIYTRKG